MPSSSSLRLQIEHTLQERIPAALSPRPVGLRESISCGVGALDVLASGGFPVGALAELVGPECCGRTTAALSFLAEITSRGSACAWIDVADALDPESAAANGVDLSRLLWVRCAGDGPAVQPAPAAVAAAAGSAAAASPGTLSPSCGGGSPHPRSEGRGMSEAIQDLLLSQPRSSATKPERRQVKIGTPGAPNRPLNSPHKAAAREEQVPTDRVPPRRGQALQKPSRRPTLQAMAAASPSAGQPPPGTRDRWQPLDRALRSADLLLQAGGFRAIVLDLGSTPAEQAWRIPMATWFRFRAACERARASVLLLTQHPCARSSAELVLRMHPGMLTHRGTVMTGVEFRGELDRQRQHRPESNVIPMRKPPGRERNAQSSAQWAARSPWVRSQ